MDFDEGHACTCFLGHPPCGHCESCPVCNCDLCGDWHETARGEVCMFCATCGEPHGWPKNEECLRLRRVSSKMNYEDLMDAYSSALAEGDHLECLDSVAHRVAESIIETLRSKGLNDAANFIADDFEITYFEG